MEPLAAKNGNVPQTIPRTQNAIIIFESVIKGLLVKWVVCDPHSKKNKWDVFFLALNIKINLECAVVCSLWGAL